VEIQNYRDASKRRASRWKKTIVARRTISKRDENKNMMMYKKRASRWKPKYRDAPNDEHTWCNQKYREITKDDAARRELKI